MVAQHDVGLHREGEIAAGAGVSQEAEGVRALGTRAEVGDGQVDLAVAVEVARGQPDRPIGRQIDIGRRREVAVAVALEDAHRAVVLVGDGHVRYAVAVEVRDDELIGAGELVGIVTLDVIVEVEVAVALPLVNQHLVVLEIGDDQVQFARLLGVGSHVGRPGAAILAGR